MSEKNQTTMKGEWFVTLYGQDGKVKEKRQGFNVVTTVGKEFLASFLSSAAAGAATFTCKYIGIGTDATAEAVGNTALGIEASRTTGTASYVSGQIFQVTATFAAGAGTGAIVEYGLFSSSSAGTLIARDTEAVINKGAGDTLAVVAQLTIS
jgi:hypothetical protein